MTEILAPPLLISIRSRPTMYLPGGRLSLWPLVSMVIDDAVDFPRCDVRVMVEEPYVLVASDVDWLDSPSLPVADLFGALVPRSAPGAANLHRAEVIIRAFTGAVLTLGESGDYADGLSLADLPDKMRAAAQSAVRALAWRMPDVR